MKTAVKQAIRELKNSVTKTSLFEVMLNSLIVFLTAHLVLSIFGISIIISASITLAYLIFETARKIDMNKIRETEMHYPKMNEKLRTADEYSQADNPVVKELHEEVLSDLKTVEEAEFIDEKKILSKSALIALLCFLILLLSPIAIKINFVEPAIEKVKTAIQTNATLDLGEGEPSGKGGGGKSGSAILPSEEDIYGMPTVAKLGEEELNLIIKPAGDTINIRQMKDIEQREFSEAYPKEVQAVSSAAYEENVPRDQQEIVKNYFTAIAQG